MTEVTTPNLTPFERGRLRFAKERRKAFKPKSRLTVPEWADRYRHLSKSVGSIGGPWRTSRVEVARGPMMAVTERGVRTITAKTCTQLLKTSLLENTIGYFSHQDPSPMLLTQPKDGSVKAFSKERLTPMANATPVLRPLLNGNGKTDTMQYREFPGGFLALESAGSPTNLAMRAIRITMADEIDKYEPTKEGDPLILLEERTSTFVTNSLHLRCCSPTRAETSRVTKSYEESDQRRAYVECPHCRYSQTLDFFRHVNWAKSEEGEHFPFTAAVYCEDCGAEWAESTRLKMMQTHGAIRWYQTKPFVCCGERQEPVKERRWTWSQKYQVGYAICKHCQKQTVPNTHAGFNASKLYSPFITMPELAAKWILSKDDPETKQTFYNTQLGLEFNQETVKSLEKHVLKTREENFAATVPLGVLILTAGVDVQTGSNNMGRLEVEVVGWGMGEESWSIETKTFIGDPAKPEIWAELDAYLLSGFDYEGGGRMVIRGVCIDSGGHHTEEVYKFCRPRIGRNVWAIKGANDRPGQKSPLWPIPKLEARKTKMTGYRPVMLGTGAAKEAIYQRLAIDEPGPGYCHFPVGRADNWYEQLTAEKQVLEKKHGFSFTRWILPKGRANEALDTRVYAYAALCGLYAVRKLNLSRIAEMISNARDEVMKLVDAAAPQVQTPEEPLAPSQPPVAKLVAKPAPKPRGPRVHRSRFLG